MNKFLFIVVSLCVCFMLSACSSTTNLKGSVSYNPKTDAKLRASGVTIFPGKKCYYKPSLFKTGGNGVRAPGNNVFFKNKTMIGDMPIAVDSPVSYLERVITAGEPVAFYGVSMSSTQVGNMTHNRSCGPVTRTFIPEAGKAYEAKYYWSGRRCGISVRELTTEDNGQVTAKAIKTSYALKCKE